MTSLSAPDRKAWMDEALENSEILNQWRTLAPGRLSEAIFYSLTKTGGKRFRPLLVLLFAEAFAVGPQRVLPWAIAVEMIHTYSLIHDDLPCMDDDRERRGQPTNHVVFGEDFALLAGDSLLTGAFGLLVKSFREDPRLAMSLTEILSDAAGVEGMIGGQALDLESKLHSLELEQLLKMHELKTGALIRASVEGAAVICGLSGEKQARAAEFGRFLGLAFQLRDDLLDSATTIEKGSIPEKIGLQETSSQLALVSAGARSSLSRLGIESGPLVELIQMNLDRGH